MHAPRAPTLVAALAVALAAAPAATAAAGRPAVTLHPPAARPGDAVLVRVRAGAGAPAGATLAGRPLQFWSRGAERWALAGLPIETPPGPAPLELDPPAPGATAAALEVVEPGFAIRQLTVPPRFVEPPAEVKERIARDHEAFAAAYARPFGPPLFSRSFAWPRRAPTSGRYGDQRLLNGQKEAVHYGLDITGPRGAAVKASNDGEVVLARDCYYSGKTVVLWHGADVFTLYFHLDRIDVPVGRKVGRGARLGTIGSTGRSTGPHLHWSARVGGLLVDPESLLAIDLARGRAPPRRAGATPERPPAELPAPRPPPEAAPAPAAGATDAAPPR